MTTDDGDAPQPGRRADDRAVERPSRAAVRTRRLALACAALTGIQVGAATVATRQVAEVAGPATLALLRYAIGFLLLAGPAAMAGPVRFARRDLPPMIGLGVLQFAVLITLYNLALRTAPAARVALVFATMPLLTMVVLAFTGRERLAGARLLGVLLTMAGVALALGDSAAGGGLSWGDAAAFASAAVGALCSIAFRPHLQRYAPVQVSALAMLASVGFLAFASAVEIGLGGWPGMTLRDAAAVAFIGVSSGVAYFSWMWALSHASPTQVSMFLALGPITATVLGAWWLGEHPGPAPLIGLAVAVAGIVIAHRDGGGARGA